jgi:hypothetical protein
LHDVFVLKIDTSGNQIWMKYFGLPLFNENGIDGVVDKNGNIVISASRFTPGYNETVPQDGWNKPWVFTIDTSGVIIEEWVGEEDDTTTAGVGPLLLMPNGDMILASFYLKNFNTQGNPDILSAHVVSRLDSNFKLLWRTDLSNFNNRIDRIRDMDYDPVREQIIVTGEKLMIYDGDYSKEVWVVKLDANGNIVWNITDTLYYSRQEEHFTAGLTLASSGSIYVGGYVSVFELEPTYQGFILKVTPDGCSDTICTTTSISEQILQAESQVILYPNPATDRITVIVKETNGPDQMRLIDMHGHSVLVRPLMPGSQDIDLDFPTGVYVASFYSSSGVIYSRKLMIY